MSLPLMNISSRMNPPTLLPHASWLPQPVPALQVVPHTVTALTGSPRRSGWKAFLSRNLPTALALGLGVAAASAVSFAAGMISSGTFFKPAPPPEVDYPASEGAPDTPPAPPLGPEDPVPPIPPAPITQEPAAPAAQLDEIVEVEPVESVLPVEDIDQTEGLPVLDEQSSSTELVTHQKNWWMSPVAGATRREVLRPFDVLLKPWHPGHRGIDISLEPGSPVRAPADGEVAVVQKVVNRHVVTIRHDNGMLSSFEPVLSELQVGDRVTAGSVIGTVEDGVPHCGTHRCVHWGLRIPDAWLVGSTRRDLYIDPTIMLGWARPSVLWPLDHDPPGWRG